MVEVTSVCIWCDEVIESYKGGWEQVGVNDVPEFCPHHAAQLMINGEDSINATHEPYEEEN